MESISELWQFVTAWYNWPFSLALLCFLGLAGLQFLGLGQEQDFDADTDVDLDIDADVDIDVDADVDMDADADLDADHDMDMDHTVDALPGWTVLLSFLGVGQAPLTMVLLILLGTFGFLGWFLNSLIVSNLSFYPPLAILPIFGVALFGGGLTASRTARFIGRAVPALSTTATSMKNLVSRQGRVVSAQVDQQYGQVKVRDKGGTLITVFAVVDSGESPIERDTEVFLVEYNKAKKVFFVVPAE